MAMRIKGGQGAMLAADEAGPQDGTPVLLVHGMGQTRHSWRGTVKTLSDKGYRAIAIDLRGHGESDRAPDGDYSFSAFVSDIEAVVQGHLGKPAVLIGASLGGKAALAAAGYLGPSIARALVLCDTVPRTIVGGGEQVGAAMYAPPEGFETLDAAAESLAAARGKSVVPGAGEKLRRNMRQDDAGRWHWHWDPDLFNDRHKVAPRFATGYLEDAARALTIPTLLLRGEHSVIVDEAGARALGEIVPQLQTLVVPNAGHMLVGDNNDDFSAKLFDFLDREVPPTS